MTRIFLGLMAILCTTEVRAAAPTAKKTVESSIAVLDQLDDIPAKCIPQKLLADAEAVAIIPNLIKAGFVIGGRVGHGVVVFKDKNGGWGEMRFVKLSGASFGFQAGVQSSDVVLVFKTKKGLERLLDGKRELALGGDASISAGPMGREAAAATNAKMEAEIYSYSRSRGIFAGVSLDGALLAQDKNAEDEFKKPDEATAKSAESLKQKLAVMTSEKVDRPVK